MSAILMNEATFHEALQGDMPVLVDFWAPWCPYCVKITEAYDRIAEKYAGKLVVGKINIDDEEPLSDREGVDVIPTLILYQGGKALGQIVAPESQAAIEEFIESTLPAAQKTQQVRSHDMVIIGGGPGGYTAALYAARAGLDAVVLEKLAAGGQMTLTHEIDNYPGFAEGVMGSDLGDSMRRQAERFGAKTVYAKVTKVDLKATPRVIETSEGIFHAKTVVIATGASPRELGLENEKALVGSGVAYCAACDGMFYRNKTVVVVGGGNSAVEDALLLSRLAKRVILVHRRDTLRAAKIYHDPLMKADNVSFCWNSVVTEILHDDKVLGVKLQNVQTGNIEAVACDGVFISVGRKPETDLFKDQLTLTAGGYIQAGETTETDIPGVYAVGDVREKPLRQVVTAVSDGAVAVHMAESYLAQA